MILYYVPGACSLADHIALIEARASFSLVRIERAELTPDGSGFLAKRTSDGRDFSPRGFVPALQLDDGTVLTENIAILAYIARHDDALLPADGMPRWRTLEALSFMTTELHGNFRPFFYPDATPAEKDRARQKLTRHLATLDAQLGEHPFLLGAQMTIADAYLFVMLRWATLHGIAVPERLTAYAARLTQVPSVARALAAEGLAS
ncbi:MAG: glutathione S-transferase [Myxococcales bacterium]|nr:MAG: glutathione S-transferase [Myxococcales bacterium]